MNRSRQAKTGRGEQRGPSAPHHWTRLSGRRGEVRGMYADGLKVSSKATAVWPGLLLRVVAVFIIFVQFGVGWTVIISPASGWRF